jgi:superfamily II DNA or RNA helicase
MKLTDRKIKEIFGGADYKKGKFYYENGRVRQYEQKQEGKVLTIRCVVHGTKDYQVELSMNGQDLSGYCSCPRFADVNQCKHLAAALLAYIRQPKEPIETHSNFIARSLLNTYLGMSRAEDSVEKRARLVPRISNGYSGYPRFSFQVGYDKLYVVKNISNFLARVFSGETESYGKGLSLCHEISQFDDQSQAIIRLLMNEFPEYRTFERNAFSPVYYYNPLGQEKNSIELTGKAFDEMFGLLEGQTLEEVGTRNNVQLSTGDPKVVVCVNPDGPCASVTTKIEGGYSFFGNRESLYARNGCSILNCSQKFRKNVKPFLSAGQDSFLFSLDDLPAFCSCVLPKIEDLVTIDDPESLLQKYLPDDCLPCYYFDYLPDTGLVGEIVFQYGEKKIPKGTPFSETKDVKRDAGTEMSAAQPLERWLQPLDNKSKYCLPDEDAAIEFLTDHLDELRRYGEVYVSEQLERKQISGSQAAVGISVSGGLLTLDIDTGEFPPEELEALYQSLLRKKRYHKLRDGRYLMLDGSPCEKIAEMAHMTQLTADDLKSGHVSMPTFRGLYLDQVLEKQEGMQVRRDDNYRAMIRNFKAVADSDYAPPAELDSRLRPYQRVGFQWLKTLESNGFGGILADEMGLGKTIQMIAFLSTATQTEKGAPSLVVCPASLVLNWGDEFGKFAPSLRVNLLLGNASERKAQIEGDTDADVWVTSYDLLKRDIDLYENRKFYCCVLDEGQNVKNQSTAASKAVKRINCRQRFVLTGTPIENRLSELWNLFDFLMPGYLFSHSTFVEKLEKPIVQSGDAAARRQLSLLVQPFMLRRLKRDVLKELPPKVEHIRKIQLSEEERKVYLAEAAAARKSFETGQQGKLQILAALTRLRQICCDPRLCYENYNGKSSKLEACLELCSGMAENGHQILLFSQFTTMLDRIRERLDGMKISNFTLQGSTPKKKRAQLVKEFNAGKASVFLISLKAGGTGLNLTAADVVIHYDPWWNLAAQNQATDRAHRIGQTAHVQVYKLIAKGTIEEKILELQGKKAALMDAISENTEENILTMNMEELADLLG